MNKIIIATLLLFLSIGVNSQNVENYLETEKIIKFDNKNYELVWSTHPNEVYYKQEYLTKEQTLERFKSMVTIDFLNGEFKVKDLVNQKIQELENAKKTNPIINYSVLEKDGETIIDFLMSVSSKDGKKLLVVERNIYRYTNIETEETKGLLLFSVSERAYEGEIGEFFSELKKDKNSLIIKVGNIEIPKINPKK
ncbi:hypothetical protein BST83_08800 [Polaribacter filamentus]|jgi:hypothetical protein|uniref:Lipid/polyisoprenoid-binding YceI-like domain-containing protein n=1 Tax=Polaribacter filamentus TaxID=53483 RepID=A0A2S7KX62_9FLAO|nr:hypothetical protein [Polaribacter filamentus]PQB07239.1 hypothetical protein BST83_08800 [Polaribacter filamentus]|tara:strand:- start:110 stop:694 length:585 start_codon:yes stop_codon:yes gene_type:complete